MTSPMDTQLLACPFCGKTPAICVLEDSPGELLSAWVNCSCGIETREKPTEAEAIEKWNTRASSVAQAVGNPEPHAAQVQARVRSALQAAKDVLRGYAKIEYDQANHPQPNWAFEVEQMCKEALYEIDLANAKAADLVTDWEDVEQLTNVRPFYGAQCPSYPNCKGECGLGCTREMASVVPSTEPCACLRPGGDPLGNCEECA